MLPGNDRLTYLFRKYLQDNTSAEELEELFDYIREASQHAPLKEQIMEVFRQTASGETYHEADWDTMFSGIVNDSVYEAASSARITRLRPWKSMAAAALVLILGAAGIYLYLSSRSPSGKVAKARFTRIDILPGGNKATLTLSNGATIILDSANNGMLASQGNVNIIKLKSGRLAYEAGSAGQEAGGRLAYNTLTTPRGGQYRLTLADGTKVWLNAASSIRYPTAFTGKERKVVITGEAYFEVVHNEKMPFRVQAGNEVIEDLGTHFNINAYADEPVMKTTLLEGAVSITLRSSPGGRQTVKLQPGEQAVLDKKGKIHVAKYIDAEDAVAWKNGFFSFRNDNLQTVMRQLSRWYDVDVTYQPGADNKQQFSGRIDRDLTLSQVLNGLAQAKAHFKIEVNRKVVILP